MGDMKASDRRAVEFRALLEAHLLQLRLRTLHELSPLSLSLNLQELRTLEFLGTVAPQMMREIADFLGLAVNSLVDVIDGLEERGLAVRRKDNADRRVVRVELTAEGRAAAEAVATGMLQIYKSYLSALATEEQDTLLSLFRKISQIGQ